MVFTAVPQKQMGNQPFPPSGGARDRRIHSAFSLQELWPVIFTRLHLQLAACAEGLDRSSLRLSKSDLADLAFQFCLRGVSQPEPVLCGRMAPSFRIETIFFSFGSNPSELLCLFDPILLHFIQLPFRHRNLCNSSLNFFFPSKPFQFLAFRSNPFQFLSQNLGSTLIN